MSSYGPSNDRVRMYYHGDYLATLKPDGFFIRWEVTNFLADNPAESRATGLSLTADVAWACATTAVKEMHQKEAA